MIPPNFDNQLIADHTFHSPPFTPRKSSQIQEHPATQMLLCSSRRPRDKEALRMRLVSLAGLLKSLIRRFRLSLGLCDSVQFPKWSKIDLEWVRFCDSLKTSYDKFNQARQPYRVKSMISTLNFLTQQMRKKKNGYPFSCPSLCCCPDDDS